MDDSLAIQVTNISKRYRLGSIGMTSLREDLSRWWNRKNEAQNLNNSLKRSIHENSRIINNNEFWALQKINFDVKKGEVIGLIGANGSGKSTLLKILSRITEPSGGKIRIRGKVASLLEVGTGFHPELTGRENIYINGAILGMTRKDVDKKFAEIVDFAGVNDFIDTPIKRFSSGMTVRLGFAVAAHLDPDILIVDEVLAVGDAAFQKKCMDKMLTIRDSGKTIIFVSHNMTSVETLCKTSILLDNGKVELAGKTTDIISYHLAKTAPREFYTLNLKKRVGTMDYELQNIKFFDSQNNETKIIKTGSFFKIKVYYQRIRKCTGKISFCLGIDRIYPRFRVTTFCSNFVDCKIKNSDKLLIELCIPALSLNQSSYSITTMLSIDGVITETVSNAMNFQVLPGGFYKNGSSFVRGQGQIMLDFEMHSK